MSGLGPEADWFRNIQAAPAVEVTIGRHRFRPAQRILDEDEARAVLADYERRNRLVRPLVRALLSRLVGQRYDGSEASRHLLVTRLPFVAFRPGSSLGQGAVSAAQSLATAGVTRAHPLVSRVLDP